MSYRPQFAYPTPAGFLDEPFEHFFDQTNAPALGLSIPPGQSSLPNIPLTLDPDAEFHWRGIQAGDIPTMGPYGLLFKDAVGNQLSNTPVPMSMYSGNLGPATFQGGEAQALEPEIVCPQGSTIPVTVSYLGRVPLLNPPLQLPPVSIFPTDSNATTGGQTFAAIPWLGQLFEPVLDQTNSMMRMFVSSDSRGQTWTEANAGAGPITPDPAIFWDGVSNMVTVLYQVGGRGNAAQMINFDLDTQTWQAPFAAGGPVATPEQLFQRSTGVYIATFLQDTTTSAGPIAGVATWDGTSWSAELDITTNVTGIQAGPNPESTAVLDSSDRLHVIFTYQTLAFTNLYFYQQVLANTTLGPFFNFPNQAQASQDLAGGGPNPGNRLQIVGNQIIWAVLRNAPASTPDLFAAVYVGTGLAAPTWVESGNIDPSAVLASQVPATFPALFFGNQTLSAVWVRNGQNSGTSATQVMVAWTSTVGLLTGWQSAVLFDLTLNPIANSDGMAQPLVLLDGFGNVIGLLVTILTGGEPGNPFVYWVDFRTQPLNLPITLRGVKRFGGEVCAA